MTKMKLQIHGWGGTPEEWESKRARVRYSAKTQTIKFKQKEVLKEDSVGFKLSPKVRLSVPPETL